MKRILSAIILFLATITLMAQNSFVVVDKNGNSKFVQDLIFQQQNGAFIESHSLFHFRKGRFFQDPLRCAKRRRAGFAGDDFGIAAKPCGVGAHPVRSHFIRANQIEFRIVPDHRPDDFAGGAAVQPCHDGFP